MKFLTDENVANTVVRTIRSIGFDVKDIKEEKLFGISDKKIIEIAKRGKNKTIIQRR
jgi:predicted nuclease of predicted toxin-antitoxin system